MVNSGHTAEVLAVIKIHGSLNFELPLTKCQPWKIQVIFLLIQQFFYISTLNTP